MPPVNLAKLEEAEQLYKDAEKKIKKTMFKWSPDYVLAAPIFDKAATAYKAAGKLEDARESFVKSADCYYKCGSVFKAGQELEKAAQTAMEEKRSDSAPMALEHYRKAASYFCEQGEFDKGAESIYKAAQANVENEELAVSLFNESIEMLESNSRDHMVVDKYRRTLAYLVQRKRYPDAIALLKRMIALFSRMQTDNQRFKCNLSVIVLTLALGDVVEADKLFMEHLQDSKYLHSDDCALAEGILMAFKAADEEKLKKETAKQGFNFLENQIVKVAKNLSVYGRAPKPSATSALSAPSAPTSQSFAPQEPGRDALFARTGNSGGEGASGAPISAGFSQSLSAFAGTHAGAQESAEVEESKADADLDLPENLGAVDIGDDLLATAAEAPAGDADLDAEIERARQDAAAIRLEYERGQGLTTAEEDIVDLT